VACGFCLLQGTPIGGDVAALQGQFAALQLWPFNVASWFHDNVSRGNGWGLGCLNVYVQLRAFVCVL
jgi:hypothetical protein